MPTFREVPDTSQSVWHGLLGVPHRGWCGRLARAWPERCADLGQSVQHVPEVGRVEERVARHREEAGVAADDRRAEVHVTTFNGLAPDTLIDLVEYTRALPRAAASRTDVVEYDHGAVRRRHRLEVGVRADLPVELAG